MADIYTFVNIFWKHKNSRDARYIQKYKEYLKL